MAAILSRSMSRIVSIREQKEFSYEDLVAAEMELEKDAVEEAVNRYRESMQAGRVNDMPTGQLILRQKIGAVIEGIKEWVADFTEGRSNPMAKEAKWVQQFDADEVALLTLRHVLRAITNGGERQTTLAMQVITDLESIDLEGRMKKADRRAFDRYAKIAKRRKGNQAALILKAQGKYVFERAGDDRHLMDWTPQIKARVGAHLIQLAVERTELAKIVFTTSPTEESQVGNQRNAHWIVPKEETLALIAEADLKFAMNRPTFMPMVVKPLPWKGATGGGYLRRDRAFARKLFKQGPGGVHPAIKTADLTKITEAINAMQETAWRINANVLAVFSENLAGGRSITGKSDDLVTLALPERLSFMEREEATWSDAEKEQMVKWKKARTEAYSKLNQQQAFKLTVTKQCAMAEQLVAFPALYYPHQLDWRGRAYPMASYLHPQGDDRAKALLEFAEPVALGASGMRWLAIHGANTFEVDKVSFEERVRWVRENHEAICASALDPHSEDAIWCKSKSPFQALAFCFEWLALAEHVAEGHSATTFMSRIAVGLDGSCNGLQHFSAMLRDEVGGTATNLTPSDKPSDIYSLVAEKVRSRIEMDLASDEVIERKVTKEGTNGDTRTSFEVVSTTRIADIAKFWTGVGITRKWTKRNTMTLPYGVSRSGMKDQLWSEIGGGKAGEFFGDSGLDRGPAVQYLAQKNWDAVADVVVAARQAMDWLQSVAKIVAANGDGWIRWTTPDGMPVQQRYVGQEEILVRLYGSDTRLILRPYTDAVNKGKQSSGISPNFVHSIDATHMRMVVRRLRSEGITSFAMIHDSFGSHAGNIERLAEVTREEFVVLHEMNVLEMFRAEAIPAELTEEIPPMPASGSLDLDAVCRAPYFFA